MLAELHGHQQKPLPLGISAARLDPRGHFLATTGEDATVRLWPDRNGVLSPNAQVLVGHEETELGVSVKSLDISPQERWLVTGGADGTIRLWDLTAANPGLLTAGLLGHKREVTATQFFDDGRQLVSTKSESWP